MRKFSLKLTHLGTALALNASYDGASPFWFAYKFCRWRTLNIC
jgi:hypothetical protein